MNYWLVKSEPYEYSWENFVNEGVGVWSGVRNYAARLNLLAMKIDDLVFFYHSNEGMEIVGIAKVVKEAYPDPTSEDQRWVAVNLSPVEKLPKTVKLSEIKVDNKLREMALIRLSRLSVQPVRKDEFDYILSKSYENI